MPLFINLLPDAELWSRTGRVGEQRLLLVQYWRQMQKEMAKDQVAPESSVPAPAAAASAPAVQPQQTAATGAIALGPSTAIPTLAELDDDVDEVVAAPEAQPVQPTPEVPAAAASDSDILGQRTSWVPASVLFAKPPEPADAGVPAGEPPPVPLVVDEPAAPLVHEAAPEPALVAAVEPAIALEAQPVAAEAAVEPEAVAAVEPAIALEAQPLAAEAAVEPEAVAAVEPAIALEAQPVAAEPIPAPEAVSPIDPAIALELGPEPAEPLVDEFRTFEPEVVLPDIDVSVVPAASMASLEGDREVDIAFVAPSEPVRSSLPELPSSDAEFDVTSVPVSFDVPAVSGPALEMDVAAELVDSQPADLIADAQAARASEPFDGLTDDLFLQAQADDTTAAGPPVPVDDAPPVAAGRIGTALGVSTADDVPLPSVSTAATPDVEMDLVVDITTVDLPDDRPEPALDIVGAIEHGKVESLGSVLLPPAGNASPDVSPGNLGDAFLKDPNRGAAAVELPPVATADEQLRLDSSLVSERIAEQPAVPAARTETPTSASAERMTTAEPATAGAPRDARLRRAGVIPMPAARHVPAQRPRVNPALPALERFLRSAEARRRQVAAESVA